MFGQDNQQQATMGSPTVQNPSMLDNVSSTDFQTTNTTPQPAVEPSAQVSSPSTSPTAQPPADPAVTAQQPTNDTHPITSDDPFIQTVATPQSSVPEPAQAEPVFSSPFVSSSPAETTTTEESEPTSNAGPINPPVLEDDSASDQTSYINNLTSDSTTTNTEVDQEKLAEMKREALEHLEPLAEHLDGTPEETFKTTMMMIQANDNHTLLDKALESAKNIQDDKARAQAMLDIINEINYFSQQAS